MRNLLIAIFLLFSTTAVFAGDVVVGGTDERRSITCNGWAMGQSGPGTWEVGQAQRSFITYGFTSHELLGYLDGKFIGSGKWVCDVSNG